MIHVVLPEGKAKPEEFVKLPQGKLLVSFTNVQCLEEAGSIGSACGVQKPFHESLQCASSHEAAIEVWI
jgi:hypothetical protein